MKYRYFLTAFLAFILCYNNTASAQLVGDNTFMQGRWLEACVAPNGSWGNTVTPPATYHTYTGGSTSGYTDPGAGSAYSGGATIDFTYDANHDGWGVAIAGSENFYGPYYLPGTPFDGWTMQVNGKLGQAFYTTAGFSTLGGAVFHGTNTGYTNTLPSTCLAPPATAIGIWQGYFIPEGTDTLKIYTENRVDTLSSWDVVTVKFTNVSATTMTGLYYMATADPDNDEPHPGGSFPTNNHIQFQNDYRHRVMVEGRPPTAHQDAYSSLCTRDCRAKSLIYVSWPPSLTAGNDLDLVYAGTATGMSTCYYGLGNWTWSQDIAYGLVYNLGNLAAGDSTIISFAWQFKDSTCTDSAFPDPVLVVNGAQVGQPDTAFGCVTPIIPVCILHGAEKDWSWASWTWSPAVGLSATTGVSVTINSGMLTAPTTYTITGNDSTTGMHSCNNFVLYLTVMPCFSAINNGPICMGDILRLDATGDSIGATYQWYNPGGILTSTLHHVVINPATYADSGTWFVIRIIGGAHDTARTHVIIEWKPTLTLSSNAPLCFGMVDTLRLGALPDSVGETFSWTGPGGFTSTLANPTFPGYTAADTGFYTVIATSSFGCKDTAKIDAGIMAQPPTPVISGITTYCSGNVFVPFTVSGYTGTLMWYPTAVGGVGSTTAPTVNTAYGGTYTFWVSQIVGTCESLRGSITVQVIVTPSPPTITGTSVYCQYDTYVPPTAAGPNILWYITPTGGVGSITVPTISTAVVGVTTIYATQMDSGCTSARGPFTITVNVKPPVPVISGITSYCQNDVPVPFTVTGIAGTTFLWYTVPTGGVGSGTPTPINTATAGVTTYWVSQTTGLCESDRVSITVTVRPTPALPVITGKSVYCQYEPYIPPVAVPVGTGIIYWFSTIGGVGTLTPPTISTILPGTITIYASQTDSGCVSPVDSFVITINPKPNPPYVIDSPDQYCPGVPFVPFTIVDGTNVLWYVNDTGGIGDTTKAVMSTIIPGIHTVWVTQTVLGCESDRIAVSIKVYDSVIAGFTDVIKLGCNGDSVRFTNTSTGATNYEWEFGDGYSNNEVNPLHVYHTQGSFLITLYARSSTCVDSNKQTILLNHPLSADFTIAPTDTVCQFNPVTFTSTTPAISPVYLWNFDDGSTGISANPVHTYPIHGIYSVSLTVTDFVPCSVTVTKIVVVDTISPIQLVISDSVFCRGTFSTFTGLFASFGNTGVTWNFGDGIDTSKNMNPIRHGYSYADSFIVTVTALYRACPETSAARKVWVLPQPEVDLGTDTTICPGGDPILLMDKINGGTSNATWLWNTGQTTPSILVGTPGVYTVKVDIEGCITTDSVIVSKDCYMNIPNIFTPNGDGVNDYFYPRQYLTKGLINFKMNIFNRWGELIFESTSLDGRGWDGKYNNIDQPEGVYIYIIDGTYKDGQKEHHQGNITLLR